MTSNLDDAQAVLLNDGGFPQVLESANGRLLHCRRSVGGRTIMLVVAQDAWIPRSWDEYAIYVGTPEFGHLVSGRIDFSVYCLLRKCSIGHRAALAASIKNALE